MLNFFTRNFWLKIASFAIGFLIWFSIIVYQDPYITKDFNNIEVEKKNEYLITNQKKEINYLEGNTIDIRVKGKKSVIDKLTIDQIKASADLKYISVTGAVDIDVTTKDIITVLELTPNKMIVNLEDIITVQREIQYLFEGTAADNYMVSEPVLTPNYINITGAESKINQIRKVIVPINIEGITKDLSIYSKPQILDYRNEEIPGLKTNISELKIEAIVNLSKSIPILFTDNKTLPPNYILEKVTIEPNLINIAGSKDLLQNIKSINLSNIDMSAMTGTTQAAVSIAGYLPEGVILGNKDAMVTLTFNIEPIVTRIIEIPTQQIKISAVPKDLSINYVNDLLEISVTGKESLINALSLIDFDILTDMTGIDQVGFKDLKVLVSGPATITIDTPEVIVPIELKRGTASEPGITVTE